MSDFFSSLFGGGGGGDGGGGAPAGGGGGGDFLSSLFGGGGGGGDGSGGLFGGGGGGLGMGNFDPSQMFQQTPQQAAAQGGDPGGQLSGVRGGGGPDQTASGQTGQTQGQGQGQVGQPPSFFKLFGDALSGRMQQPGYTPLGGVASQAAQNGQLPAQPSFDQPSNTSDPTRIKVPGEMPGGPPGAPQPGAQPGAPGAVPGQSPAAQAKGEEAGGLAPGQATEEAPLPPARPASLGPGEDINKDPHPGTPHDTAGQPQPGAPGQRGGQPNQFGQFMQGPLGQIVQALIGQMLGRMGPGGAALGQILSPMLAQLAGQAGFGGQGGQGGSQWNPETPAIDRGGDWMNRAIPGGAAGVLNDVKRRESGGNYNLRPEQNFNYPRSHASGAYQFQPGTWRRWTQASGIGTQYREAYQAPPHIQDQIAAYALQHTPGGANSPSLWGASAKGRPYAQVAGGRAAYGNINPNYADLPRRRRQRMSMGWQF
jgi:hypothetical protein